MRNSRLLWLLLPLLGCAQLLAAPPPPLATDMVAILPPNNRTGAPLSLARTSFGDLYAAPAESVTVADMLAAEVRAQLMRHGLSVVAPNVVEFALDNHTPSSPQEATELAVQGKLEGSALYLEIQRWEPDIPTFPTFVSVALGATLIDSATGRVIWTYHRPARPVPMPGAVSQWAASQLASYKVVEELLAEWRAEQPAS